MKEIVFVIVLIALNASCINKDVQINKSIGRHLIKDQVYLAFRGTDTKEGYYAKEYNISDSLSTHVGFAIYEKPGWQVYHIVYSNSEMGIRRNSISEFYDSMNEKVNYVGLWLISELDNRELIRVKYLIKEYHSKPISFDNKFSLSDSTKLYCSEFVNLVLTQTNEKKFNFNPLKVKLSALHSMYLGRDSLVYYPVDIFKYNKHITKIVEYR